MCVFEGASRIFLSCWERKQSNAVKKAIYTKGVYVLSSLLQNPIEIL